MLEFGGHKFEAVVGSDVDRDGMYLQLTNAAGEPVAEVFYSDVDGAMTFTTYQPALPLEAAEWLIAHARVRLPPPR